MAEEVMVQMPCCNVMEFELRIIVSWEIGGILYSGSKDHAMLSALP